MQTQVNKLILPILTTNYDSRGSDPQLTKTCLLGRQGKFVPPSSRAQKRGGEENLENKYRKFAFLLPKTKANQGDNPRKQTIP